MQSNFDQLKSFECCMNKKINNDVWFITFKIVNMQLFLVKIYKNHKASLSKTNEGYDNYNAY